MQILVWLLAFFKLLFALLNLIAFVGIPYFLIIGSIKLAKAKNRSEFFSRLLYNLCFIIFFSLVIWGGVYYFS